MKFLQDASAILEMMKKTGSFDDKKFFDVLQGIQESKELKTMLEVMAEEVTTLLSVDQLEAQQPALIFGIV